MKRKENAKVFYPDVCTVGITYCVYTKTLKNNREFLCGILENISPSCLWVN